MGTRGTPPARCDPPREPEQRARIHPPGRVGGAVPNGCGRPGRPRRGVQPTCSAATPGSRPRGPRRCDARCRPLRREPSPRPAGRRRRHRGLRPLLPHQPGPRQQRRGGAGAKLDPGLNRRGCPLQRLRRCRHHRRQSPGHDQPRLLRPRDPPLQPVRLLDDERLRCQLSVGRGERRVGGQRGVGGRCGAMDQSEFHAEPRSRAEHPRPQLHRPGDRQCHQPVVDPPGRIVSRPGRVDVR